MDSQAIAVIRATRLHGRASSSLWDVYINDGKIYEIVVHENDDQRKSSNSFDAGGRLLLPSLCHAHIHLDKCFILSDPEFEDLKIQKGDFSEAMKATGTAKSRFSTNNIISRGRRLIQESLAAGVTSLRAFVEVDEIVSMIGIHAALALKEEFAGRCDIQVCAFAQLALFSGGNVAEQRRDLLLQALQLDSVEAIGSTPYVEDYESDAEENVRWTIQQAITNNKHLDFHLDYNVDHHSRPLIWHVLENLRTWPLRSSRSVCIGHCTRAALFSEQEMTSLQNQIRGNNLPITFIGLPTSDLYMMGRPVVPAIDTMDRSRGTLQVPHMAKIFNLDVALAINNAGNAFTPYASCDPLQAASFGMLVYQSATIEDCVLLYQCVSSRSKRAIGRKSAALDLEIGDPADLILFGLDNEHVGMLPFSVSDVIQNPMPSRVTFNKGRVVAECSRKLKLY